MSSGRVAHAQAAPLSPLGKTGGLGKGLGLELVGLGPAEAWTRVGGAAGVSPNTAVQLDLGARWALRLPLSLDLTFRDGCVAYAAIAFTQEPSTGGARTPRSEDSLRRGAVRVWPRGPFITISSGCPSSCRARCTSTSITITSSAK